VPVDRLTRAVRSCAAHPSTCVLHHVSRTSRAVVSAFGEALKPSGLTGQQFNVLMSLAQAGPLTVTRLARVVGMDPTTVPRALRPLRRRGLVGARTTDDRRERVIFVTAAGRRQLAAAVPLWDAVQRRVVRVLGSREWDALMVDLRAVRRALESSAPAARS
jgi:DNA-binding MarR family transcriptional regulator